MSRAFDDCIVTESIFKLLHIFGTLTQRNLIALELSDKMPLLVCMLNTEMDEAKNIFIKQQKRIKETGKALTDRNMPPVSGQLKFAQELRDKISASIRNFKELSHPICYSEGANLVFRKFKEMIAVLSTYEEEAFKGWALCAEKKTAEGLNRPLIIRDENNGTLKVNFGRDTLSILMEVKHMKKDFPTRKLPEKALEIFQRFDDFRNYNNSLEQTVSLYNYLKLQTVEQEYKLIHSEIAYIDEKLEAAEKSLNWNSENIWDYIEGIRKCVADLNLRVRKAQDNVIKINKQITAWETVPLFERLNESKQEPLLNVRDKEENKTRRYAEITQAAMKIKSFIDENEVFFKVTDPENKNWLAYLKYLDQMITDGLLRTIAVSLGYLLDETDCKKNVAPLFDAKLELCEPDIIFQPSLDINMADKTNVKSEPSFSESSQLGLGLEHLF